MSSLRDVMSEEVLTLSPEMTVSEAAMRLREAGIGGAAVVDRGRVVGVVTNSDLRSLLADLELDDSVGQVMSRRVVALPPSADLSDAAAVMEREHVHRVLVMEGNTLYGIVSSLDVAKAFGHHDAG